jgi:L-alanine-DL-glutamate epimerase-like enolase superfamily enzyme
MKITSVRVERRTIRYTPRYHGKTRSVGPLDIFEKYRLMENSGTGEQDIKSDLFIIISTDEGVEGEFGPVEDRSVVLTVMDGIASHLIGSDPMENRQIWEIISRFDRHARSGVMMMAISAVDIALWDLKGKILGLPVYKILGGGRNSIRPYVSMLSFSVEPAAVRERALWVRDMGIKAQKWFFRYGPGDGVEGVKRNLEMAYTLREALGPFYDIMFDCWMGWTIDYARQMFREIEAVNPRWVEDVLRPHMMDGYRNLKQDTGIPLAAGEHIYTRMEVNAYLRENIFSVMQSDTAWCGGITEAMKIGDLCQMYGITFIPHGHTLKPCLHVVASLPEDVAPYCEYLLNFMDRKNSYFTHNRVALGEEGLFAMDDTPGIGDIIDKENLINSEIVTCMAF